MGRSLHRHKSNVKFPRYILGLRFLKAEGEEEASGGLDLMIAYAPLAKQYEVISWNSAREEYDFFIVDHIAPENPLLAVHGKASHASPKPKTVLPRRGVCLECHQAGGPIFTPFPWDESTGQTGLSNTADLWRRAFQRVQAQRQGTEIPNDRGFLDTKSRKQVKNFATRISDEDLDLFEFSFPFRQLVGSINNFTLDDNIRRSNQRLQIKKFCRQLCQSDECKQLLLLSGLIEKNIKIDDRSNRNGILSSSTLWPSHKDINLLSQLMMETRPQLSANGFAYPSSVLIDRNPLKNQAQGGLGHYFKITDQKAILNVRRIEVDAEKASFFDQIIAEKLAREGDASINYNEDNTLAPVNTRTQFTQSIPISSPRHPQSFLNPRKKRPLVNRITPLNIGVFLIKKAHQCLDLNANDLESIGNIGLPEALAFFKEYPISPTHLDHFPPPKQSFLAEIKAKLKSFREGNNDPCFYTGVVDTSQDIAVADFLLNAVIPQVIRVEAKAVDPQRASALYQKHCISCHSQKHNVGIVLPLPGDGDADWANQIRKYKVDQGEIPLAAKRIMLGEMPLGQEISDDDRMTMINFLLAQ